MGRYFSCAVFCKLQSGDHEAAEEQRWWWCQLRRDVKALRNVESLSFPSLVDLFVWQVIAVFTER